MKVELRAAEKNLILSRPTTDARYDFVIDDGTKLTRAQVKYAGGKTWNSTGAVRVDLRRWSGWPEKMTKTYLGTEVDVLLVYVPQTDKILAFSCDVFERKCSLQIRLSASVNNQKKGILLADNFVW